jgi:hypothetical protein
VASWLAEQLKFSKLVTSIHHHVMLYHPLYNTIKRYYGIIVINYECACYRVNNENKSGSPLSLQGDNERRSWQCGNTNDPSGKRLLPANALIRERSKSLELEFPPSYSYSSTISCCSVGSQPPRTTEMSVVILSIRPTAHFCGTLMKGAPETI